MKSSTRQAAVALGIVVTACAIGGLRRPTWSPQAPAPSDAAVQAVAHVPAMKHVPAMADAAAPATPRMSSGGLRAMGEVAFQPDRDEAEPGVRYGYGRRSFSVGITPCATVFAQPSAAAAEAAASRTPADVLNLLAARLSSADSASADNAADAGDAAPLVRFRMDIVGADPSAPMHGEDAAAWRTNVYRGGDPSAWREGVPNYRRVRASGVLPGIDVVHRPQGRRVAFDFVVAPGADPSAIALAFAVDDDTKPAVRIDARGDLVVASGAESMRFGAPVVYQESRGGDRVPVAGKYVLRAVADGRTEVAFEVAAYDRTRPLVIDPAVFEVSLGAASYLGGTGNDNAQGVELGPNGEIFVLSLTTAPFFADNRFLGGATGGGFDSAVAQIEPNGAVLGNAVFGGSGTDFGYALAVAPVSGDVFVCGSTIPQSGPTAVAFPSTVGTYPGPGGASATTSRGFVLGLDSSLRLESAAVVACNGPAGFRGIDVTDTRVALCGVSSAQNFPTSPDAAFPTYPAGAFSSVSTATVLSYDLTTFLAGTWIGENNGTAGDVAFKPGGNLVFVGYTAGTGLPSINAPQGAPGGGTDGYFVEMLGDCTAATVWTPVGGPGFDLLLKLWVPPSGPFAGDAIFAGAGSEPFTGPTNSHSGGNDCLIGCVRDGAFSFLQWVGGTGNEIPTCIAGVPGGFGVQSYSTSFDRYPLADGAGPGGGASDTAFDFFTITNFGTLTSTAAGLQLCRVGGGGGDVPAGFVHLADIDGAGPDADGVLSVGTCSADDAVTTPGAAQAANASEGAATDDGYVSTLKPASPCPKPATPQKLRIVKLVRSDSREGLLVTLAWTQPRSNPPVVKYRILDVTVSSAEPGPHGNVTEEILASDAHKPGSSSAAHTVHVPPGFHAIYVHAINDCSAGDDASQLVCSPDNTVKRASYNLGTQSLEVNLTRAAEFLTDVLAEGTATVDGADADPAQVSGISSAFEVAPPPSAAPAKPKPKRKTVFRISGRIQVQPGSKTGTLHLSTAGLTVPVKLSLKLTINGRSKPVKFTLRPPKT